MIAIRYPLVPRRADGEHLTLEAAAARVGLHPLLVERFLELGLLEPAARIGGSMRFDATCFRCDASALTAWIGYASSGFIG